MKESLKVGLSHELRYRVPEERTVPSLLPESEEFQSMPRVLASGYMIGLIEWTCIQAANPHLDWPREQTLGIGFELSHSAPTPPGGVVTIRVSLETLEGRKMTWAVRAHDDLDLISEGYHHRFVIRAEQFNAKVAAKKEAIDSGDA